MDPVSLMTHIFGRSYDYWTVYQLKELIYHYDKIKCSGWRKDRIWLRAQKIHRTMSDEDRDFVIRWSRNICSESLDEFFEENMPNEAQADASVKRNQKVRAKTKVATTQCCVCVEDLSKKSFPKKSPPLLHMHHWYACRVSKVASDRKWRQFLGIKSAVQWALHSWTTGICRSFRVKRCLKSII